MKNKIILYYTDPNEENAKKQKIELFNFAKVDHYKDTTTGKYYLRILCDSKYYYFLLSWVVISEIEIY